jgi:thioredoxin reductase (NADPH)
MTECGTRGGTLYARNRYIERTGKPRCPGRHVPAPDVRAMARMAAHGTSRPFQAGEIPIQQGDQTTRFYTITAGEVEIVRLIAAGEELIVVHGPGEFVGDVHMLSGRRSVVRARGRTSGTLIELSRDGLLALIQTDSDLSGILMRAFILRRVELMSSGRGDVVLVGSAHSSGTLRLKEFLSRNGYPYSYLDLEKDPTAQELLDRFNVPIDEIPIVLCPRRYSATQ